MRVGSSVFCTSRYLTLRHWEFEAANSLGKSPRRRATLTKLSPAGTAESSPGRSPGKRLERASLVGTAQSYPGHGPGFGCPNREWSISELEVPQDCILGYFQSDLSKLAGTYGFLACILLKGLRRAVAHEIRSPDDYPIYRSISDTLVWKRKPSLCHPERTPDDKVGVCAPMQGCR